MVAPQSMGGLTAVLIGIAQLANQASTGFVYGIFNGVLNIMGAFNFLIRTGLATRLVPVPHRGLRTGDGPAGRAPGRQLAPSSMRHQHRDGHVPQQAMADAADQCLP